MATMIAVTFFLIPNSYSITNKEKIVNSVDFPDFAYPKTVIAKAETSLDKAIKSNDGILLVKSLIQIAVAEDLVSHQNLPAIIDKIDSLSNTQSTPIKSLMKLTEATLYYNLYNENSRKYDSRNISFEKFPSDPTEWSKDLYAVKILELLKETCKPYKELLDVPSTDYSELYEEKNSDSYIFYPSLFDIVAYNSISLLQPFVFGNYIPFGCVSSKKYVYDDINMFITQIYDKLIFEHRMRGEIASEIKAIESKVCASEDALNMLIKEYEKYSLSQYSAEFLISLANYVDDNSTFTEKKYYNLCKSYLEKFSNSYCADTINEIVSKLVKPLVSLRKINERFFSDEDVKITVNLKNTDTYYLKLLKAEIPQHKDRKYIDYKDYKLLDTIVVKVNRKIDPTIAYVEELNLGKLDYGYYKIAVSYDNQYKNIPLYNFVVSDLQTIYVSDYDNVNQLYVLSAKDGFPIENAKVITEDRNYTTNIDGFAPIKERRTYYSVGKSDDKLVGNIYAYKSDIIKRNEYKIFTDLSIYHPGDIVKFSVVSYQQGEDRFNILTKQNIEVFLLDVNRRTVGQLKLITDSTGRAYGNFELPREGVLGCYRIEVKSNQSMYTESSVDIRVEEYKTPSFFVELSKGKESVNIGDKVVVNGCVKTYSGMPLANAVVKYNINYYRWWSYSKDANFADETVTDDNGDFRIELTTDLLKGTQFESGSFVLNVTATSESGETQSAPDYHFYIGMSYDIEPNINGDIILADAKTIDIDINVLSYLKEKVQKWIDYELVNKNDSSVRITGRFISPKFVLKSKDIPSGVYTLNLSLAEDTSVRKKVEFVVCRTMDKQPPYRTSLWVMNHNVKAKNGMSESEITYFTGNKGAKILCVVSDNSGILSCSWLTANKNRNVIRVPNPPKYNKTIVRLIATYSGETVEEIINIIPSSDNDKLEIERISFRNKLIPGHNEVWRFKLKHPDYTRIPVLATMTDKALNAIADYTWNFTTNFYQSSYVRVNYDRWSPIENTYINIFNSDIEGNKSPTLNFYGLMDNSRRRYRGIVMAESTIYDCCETEESSLSLASDRLNSNIMFKQVVKEELNMEQEFEIKYSEIEHPSAFFYPNLITDNYGNLEFEFDVPNYNTTWQFQILGYTRDLSISLFKTDVLANKPIMVRSNLPRFVRTGDDVRLCTTLFNNSEVETYVSGKVVLFNLLNNEILTEKTFNDVNILPNGSSVVEIYYTIPNTLESIGFKVYATTGDFTDGEQSAIAVLPSSSPVIESTPFYMPEGQCELTMLLPETKDCSRLTFDFCDNPIWYCVTALPEIIIPDSNNVLSLITALYGNAISNGIVERYPQIREALNLMFEDKTIEGNSILTSALNKNTDEKIVDLNNTIWINDAESDEKRMANLFQLLDKDKNHNIIENIIMRISQLQTDNGGWKWHSESKESIFITCKVLLYFAMLKDMGFLPSNKEIEDMISRGIGYVDKELLNNYQKHKKISEYEMLDYLYIRSFFDIACDGFNELKDKALKSIMSNWKKYDIYNKATVAILLCREGYLKESLAILESLRQFASVSETKGIYYDNIGSDWNGYNRLITTSQVLEAFHEIMPDDNIINELRQWLLIQRQTQDWGKRRYTSEVIYAILSTGSDWTTSTALAKVWIDNNEFKPSQRELLTGCFKLNFDKIRATEIKIETDGMHPSWGGLMSQYIAPINDIKSSSIEDLSIEKKIYVVENTGEGTMLTTDTLKVGQKIRVQLTITNKRDLEYVVVHDERGGFMEPISQVSCYSVEDGVWTYREVRNTENNLFIDFLHKGTYILTYDCYVNNSGKYSIGIATIQSQYAPLLTAHSAGEVVSVMD